MNRKMKKYLTIILIACVIFTMFSGCQREEEFVYPPLEAFAFDVKSSSNVVKLGESIEFDCVLKNVSEENYYIYHNGSSTFFYTLEGSNVTRKLPGRISLLKKGKELTDTIMVNITPEQAGIHEAGIHKITIFADVNVLPSEELPTRAEGDEGPLKLQKYYYEKEFIFEVRE